MVGNHRTGVNFDRTLKNQHSNTTQHITKKLCISIEQPLQNTITEPFLRYLVVIEFCRFEVDDFLVAKLWECAPLRRSPDPDRGRVY